MLTPAPAQIGRYRIISELGRGAMGVVYGAEDPLLARRVAIKTILMSGDADERADYERRFYQEAKAAGSLNHPNIITIHDIGREGDIAYMAMEILEGVELRSLMAASLLPLPRALAIAAQVADGIAFAHQRGVVHRDIKPANVMVLTGDLAKIMDFGIARLRISEFKTQTGMLLGSPKYMSPEQVAGRPVDHRSDIFSLGVMLHEMVTGAPPFSGSDITQLMHAIGTLAPRPPSQVRPGLPALLDLIVAKALAKPLAERYQDAGELARDLRACLVQARPGTEAEGAMAPAAPGYAATTVLVNATAGTEPYASTTPDLQPVVAGLDAARRFAVSRKFDASATLTKLKSQTATTTMQPAHSRTMGTGTHRWMRRRDQRALAATLALALCAAFVIAVI